MIMTQKEIAEKYGVPQCDVSVAIRYIEHVNAVGKRDVVTSTGKNITVNEYEENKVSSALVKLYIQRSDNHLAKAREWTNKADAILAMRMMKK